MPIAKIEFDKNKDVSVLHEKYKVGPELNVFHLTYNFNSKTELWQFMGYRCTKCERNFKKKETLTNHLSACHILKRKKKYMSQEIDEKAVVLTPTREVWRPYESNQN